jgi:hypothetical protein
MGHGRELRELRTSTTTTRSSSPSVLEPLHLAVDQYLHSEVGAAGGRYAGRIHELVLELKEFLGAAAQLAEHEPLPVPLTCDECPFVALSQQLGDSRSARARPGAPQGSPATVPPAGST